MSHAPLPRAFYARPTLDVARALIGKLLWRRTAAGLVGGEIVETEAYVSAMDAAAHGYGGVTPRTATMYGPPGHAYIYFTYGMHHCLNCVTETEGVGAAVLLRALRPVAGQELIRQRRGATVTERDLLRGPARLCQALALTRADDGLDLMGDALWLTDNPDWSSDTPIATSPRIGISRAIELPWRFYLTDSQWVSGTGAHGRVTGRHGAGDTLK
ncbi:MAG TPA: DNA-3-methyladenine glycosylase [Ktedonobacterales bacterium]|nr:DNA-3-methyladenine glycosylase [Ktedonobacterales bacterium]